MLIRFGRSADGGKFRAEKNLIPVAALEFDTVMMRPSINLQRTILESFLRHLSAGVCHDYREIPLNG